MVGHGIDTDLVCNTGQEVEEGVTTAAVATIFNGSVRITQICVREIQVQSAAVERFQEQKGTNRPTCSLVSLRGKQTQAWDGLGYGRRRSKPDSIPE